VAARRVLLKGEEDEWELQITEVAKGDTWELKGRGGGKKRRSQNFQRGGGNTRGAKEIGEDRRKPGEHRERGG